MMILKVTLLLEGHKRDTIEISSITPIVLVLKNNPNNQMDPCDYILKSPC
jgi:hypothetical protein